MTATAADAIVEQGIVGIVRTASAAEATRAVDTLFKAGLNAVEFSLVTPGAIDVVREYAARAVAGTHVGVGTVLTPDDVRRSADAGASFIVSPILRADVLSVAQELGLTSLPGVATPTEAMTAVDLGSSLVKIFPASLWSPAVLKEMLVALPQLRTVHTGGVTLATAGDWIRAGAVAVGIGGALTRASNPESVVTELVTEIAAAR